MASLSAPEAEALAHLATVETGLEAWSERVDEVRWAVVVRDGATDRRLEDGTAYRIWRDLKLGVGSPANVVQSPGSVLLGLVGRVLGGMLTLVTQAINVWAGASGNRSRTEALQQMEDPVNRAQAQGYGYRQTHPPRSGR